MVGCGGPYEDLEKEFPAKLAIEGEVIKSTTIVLTSKNHKGAYSLNGVASIQLSPEFVEIDIELPRYKKVQIPIENISGCSKSCFSNENWDADILLGSNGIEISIEKSGDVIEWCWENGLPMISGKDVRNWMYGGGELPSREDYQQVGREEYKRQTKKQCQGY